MRTYFIYIYIYRFQSLIEFCICIFSYNACFFIFSFFPFLFLFSQNEYIWLVFGRVLMRLYILLSSRVTSSPEYVSRFTNDRTTRKTVVSTSVTRTILSHERISFRKETSKGRFTPLQINFSSPRKQSCTYFLHFRERFRQTS